MTNGARDSTERAAGESPPSRDVMFDLLGNSRRRGVLRHLLDERAISLRTLSAHLAAEENETTITDLPSRQRKQMYSSLYQTHVPQLSEHDLVAYDSDDRVVRLTGDPDRLRRFLNVAEPVWGEITYQWSQYFLWTAVVGSGIIACKWLDTIPLANVTTESLYGLLTAAFMMLSVSFAMAVEGKNLLRLGN